MTQTMTALPCLMTLEGNQNTIVLLVYIYICVSHKKKKKHEINYIPIQSHKITISKYLYWVFNTYHGFRKHFF